MSNSALASQFLIQLIVILLVIRLFGVAGSKIKQPLVVAEMVTGIVLGPSLLGLFFPYLQHQLFPGPSIPILYVLSQFGVILYMFMVGLEFKSDMFKSAFKSAMSVGIAGLLGPFILGIILTLVIEKNDYQSTLFRGGGSLWQGALFLGLAMSITAFPVLARIISESGLTNTTIGTVTLGAGALDDVVVWCILPLILIGLKIEIIGVTFGGVGFYLIVLFFGLKPALKRLTEWGRENKRVKPLLFPIVLILLFACAWLTDFIGLHAIFGAFTFGTIVPGGVFGEEITRHLQSVTVNILLPLFFVYAGLNTQFGLLNTVPLLVIFGLILLTAMLGKGLFCWLAARVNGYGQREAIAIGTLMNVRGLVELLVLNIGLDRGIITPTLFTMMALMALITTFIASPFFLFVYRTPRQTLQ